MAEVEETLWEIHQDMLWKWRQQYILKDAIAAGKKPKRLSNEEAFAVMALGQERQRDAENQIGLGQAQSDPGRIGTFGLGNIL